MSRLSSVENENPLPLEYVMQMGKVGEKTSVMKVRSILPGTS